MSGPAAAATPAVEAERTLIDRLWPDPAADLDDEALLATYAFPADRPWLRMNFISSLDGAATRQGRSGFLGDDADRRVFDLLRREADAVLVAAGTVRTEGYGAMRLDAAAIAWREAHGLPAQPVFVLVSRSLDLDPDASVFTRAPMRPIVVTVDEAPADRRATLTAVADVVTAGAGSVDPARLRAELASRGLQRVHAEGGPTLFGSFLAGGGVDELCLTLAPALEAGDAVRIAHSAVAAPTEMRLSSVLRAGSELLLRYVRDRSAAV
ncbi:pyrimidine reductase family protein [Agrococcus beijingensis]|uniref:pyrimidine reductase family protein n=1 Tax=Agrococcus beijingensis TaxID=3068634 RepID=UPI0027408B81|nr:pyrimidine reductase family protein [Agrococcus sp. REN33]